MIAHKHIEYSSSVTVNLLSSFQCNKELYSYQQSPKQHAWKVTVRGPHNACITDPGPALECPSSTLSSNTALERALPSFSLHLTMVTNDSRDQLFNFLLIQVS